MIKKLDILVVRAFIGPFVATFLIALFVLIMQTFWLYIDDLVGKGLESSTIAYLTGVVAITWIPMALPLALLISSIMTFGNLGETFEIVAIKANGIPLLRFMRPLIIITCIISVIAFVFANNIIPVAQLKFETLKHDIIVKKPAFDIKEGVFYNKLQGYVLKIGKKEKDDSTIRNIVIYEKNSSLQDHFIAANSGIMRVTNDSKFLEFILHDGWRYQEKGPRYSQATEFYRLGFKEYKMVFDLSSFSMGKSKEDNFKYDPKMLSIRQLNKTMDSLLHKQQVEEKDFANTVALRFPMLNKKGNFWQTKQAKYVLPKLTDSVKLLRANQMMSMANSFSSSIVNKEEEIKTEKNAINLHAIEWHRKFTLSVACMVLFLIGAPLGSIIRKGGLGTPLVFAIIFFSIFHLLNTFGEKLSKSGVLHPQLGMWVSTLVLMPIGLFLTSKAMRDSQLFNKEWYHRIFKKIKLVKK